MAILKKLLLGIFLLGVLFLSACNSSPKSEPVHFDRQSQIIEGIKIDVQPTAWIPGKEFIISIMLQSTEQIDLIHQDISELIIFDSEETGPLNVKKWDIKADEKYLVKGNLHFKMKNIQNSFKLVIFLPDELEFNW